MFTQTGTRPIIRQSLRRKDFALHNGEWVVVTITILSSRKDVKAKLQTLQNKCKPISLSYLYLRKKASLIE